MVVKVVLFVEYEAVTNVEGFFFREGLGKGEGRRKVKAVQELSGYGTDTLRARVSGFFSWCVASKEKHNPFRQPAKHAVSDHPIISSPRQKSCAKKNPQVQRSQPSCPLCWQPKISIPPAYYCYWISKGKRHSVVWQLLSKAPSAQHNSDDCQILNSKTLGLSYFKMRPALALLGRKHTLRPHEPATRNFSKLVYNKGSMSECDRSPLR